MRDNELAALIALGSNQPTEFGEPLPSLHAAMAAMAQRGLKIVRKSRFFSSPAWPDPRDPAFVNGVVAIETALSPADVMAILHDIEAVFGRARSVRNAPRTLDLDIIDFAGLISEGREGPILPHPRAHERAFVLAPLLDVAPDWVHPVLGASGRDLLRAVEAQGSMAVPIEHAGGEA